MLQLIVSNRLEAIADALAERIEARPLPDPLAEEHIVVPHSGVGRWLQLRLAQRWGIAARLHFQLPGQAIAAQLASLPGAGPTAAWERGPLRWRLFGMLAALEREPAAAPLLRYLRSAAEVDPLAHWQLACRLADLFDAYQLYRPDWLDAWSADHDAPDGSADARWQAVLWRRLVRDIGEPPRGARLAALVSALDAGTLAPSALPFRLSLFGALPLSPLQLRWAAALATRTEVLALHCAPSEAYFGDLESPRRSAQRRARGQPVQPDAAGNASARAIHDLLASLGQRARETQALHVECWLDGSEEVACWDAPDRSRLLGWLQSALLTLEPDGTPPVEPRPSLVVHACSDPRREVEVLLDALLDLLDRDPTLAPHEIAIMAPSLDRYAPLIEAVLAATPPDRRLPVALADRRADRIHPLIQRFLWLLRLPTASCTRGELLALLEIAELRARFGLSDDGRAWIEAWADALGVVRGLDATQREALGEGASAAHTWSLALERLLVGHALGDDGGLFDGTAPFAAGDGEESALAIGALAQLLRTLSRWRLRLAEPLTPAAACRRLGELFDAFFALDGSDADALDAGEAIRDALEQLADEIADAGDGAPGPIDPVVAALEESLSQPARWQRFLGEGATVCALVPLRSVPFRVIAVLGLNDGEFPRRAPPAGFDLMARHPRDGDRRPREDDRQLLLDTLLAAREHLHLSYVGSHPRDGSVRPPAAPLAELVDALRRAFGARWAEVEGGLCVAHPSAPFAEDVFAARGGSFAAQWWPALAAERRGWRDAAPFLRAPLAPGSSAAAVDAEALLRFYRNPSRAFLQSRLGLGYAPRVESVEGEEGWSLDKSHRMALLLRLLEAGDDAARVRCLDRIVAEGALPIGAAGEIARGELAAQAAAVCLMLGGAPVVQSIDVDLAVGERRIVGSLAGLAIGDTPLMVSVYPPGGSDLLALALRRAALGSAVDACFIDLQNGSPRRHVLQPLADEPAWLGALVEGWETGQTRPLPLPPRAGDALVNSMAGGVAGEADLERVRKVWEGDGHASAEGDDADHRIALRAVDLPGSAEFQRWAARIYAPLRAALLTERRG